MKGCANNFSVFKWLLHLTEKLRPFFLIAEYYAGFNAAFVSLNTRTQAGCALGKDFLFRSVSFFDLEG